MMMLDCQVGAQSSEELAETLQFELTDRVRGGIQVRPEKGRINVTCGGAKVEILIDPTEADGKHYAIVGFSDTSLWKYPRTMRLARLVHSVLQELSTKGNGSV